MDISNITAMYSDVYANAANQTASKLKNQIDGTDYSKAEDDKLMDACKQFEAYFVEQMYKGMLKTIPESENMSNSTSTMLDYYKDQMIQSIAEQTTEQSGLGLAQMLYEQMKRNYGLDTVEAADKGETETVAEADAE
ncbi:MAG: rod-binding protein [Acetatifactor sp.]